MDCISSAKALHLFDVQVFGQVGACLFVANLLFYLLVSLPSTGRLARANTSLSYKVTYTYPQFSQRMR